MHEGVREISQIVCASGPKPKSEKMFILPYYNDDGHIIWIAYRFGRSQPMHVRQELLLTLELCTTAS